MAGTATFRRHERSALDRVIAEHEVAVITTAGGIVSNPETYALLLRRSHTIWIKARPEDHMSRVLAQPIYLASMVLLAAAVSLRLFRFGGVQKMVLGGIVAGFLLYVLSKICGDLSKAGMMSAPLAAGLPATLGGLTGLMTLLYQEDG